MSLDAVDVDLNHRPWRLFGLALAILDNFGGSGASAICGALIFGLGLGSLDCWTIVPDLDAASLGGRVLEEPGGLLDVVQDLVLDFDAQLAEVVQLWGGEDQADVGLAPDGLGARTRHVVLVAVTFGFTSVDVRVFRVKLQVCGGGVVLVLCEVGIVGAGAFVDGQVKRSRKRCNADSLALALGRAWRRRSTHLGS